MKLYQYPWHHYFHMFCPYNELEVWVVERTFWNRRRAMSGFPLEPLIQNRLPKYLTPITTCMYGCDRWYDYSLIQSDMLQAGFHPNKDFSEWVELHYRSPYSEDY